MLAYQNVMLSDVVIQGFLKKVLHNLKTAELKMFRHLKMGRLANLKHNLQKLCCLLYEDKCQYLQYKSSQIFLSNVVCKVSEYPTIFCVITYTYYFHFFLNCKNKSY